MDSMYKYVRLRKKLLQVDELHMYDLYVPMVADAEAHISFEEAKKNVREALQVLDEDYISILDEGFENRWIDVYENQGKRSGAYSWGAYGTHPYVLLNYNGSLNHVFTLAHEMGHAIHSYYSDKTQPYPYAGYRIFVAEVASTCNEALLIHYLLEHAQDDQEKAYLVNYFLDQFKGTLYRQTMFAEFEKIVHEQVQNGESLTADGLCETYYKLNQLYFGDGIVHDSQIAMEWSRIPHFYTPFYVYKYATGVSVAIIIATNILSGKEGYVEKYINMLKQGCTKKAVELLKMVDVDIEDINTYKGAINFYRNLTNELKKLI